MVDGRRAIFLGDWLRPPGGGPATQHRGAAFHADPPAGGNGEEEAGPLQPDAEKPQPPAHQRCAGRLHSGRATRVGGRGLAQ